MRPLFPEGGLAHHISNYFTRSVTRGVRSSRLTRLPADEPASAWMMTHDHAKQLALFHFQIIITDIIIDLI